MSIRSFYLIASTLYLVAQTSYAIDNRIDQIRSDAPELATYGQYQVGITTRHLLHRQQADIIHAKSGEITPLYDRPLTLEIWYPAILKTNQVPEGQYQTLLRDGKTEVTLKGRALRDASPDRRDASYPLVIVSHGYPGNRFLLSHLTENLASKGYVVVAIDHTDSTFHDLNAFSSTLLNRSLDQLFVLNEMARISQQHHDDILSHLINTDQTALIGYSMGGYGVINTIGGGLTDDIVNSAIVPNAALNIRQSGRPEYQASIDPRIKAAVAFAPWGWNKGLWNAQGLATIKTPVFFIAGSADDVSGYSPGVRNIFESTANADRYLLTFEHANHNAGAPIPAPVEAWQALPDLKRIPAETYIDAVWDNTRMNNISQHFVTAFLGKYLKKNTDMSSYLALTEYAQNGKWSTDSEGNTTAEHTYWKGFPQRTAVGLRLEFLPAVEIRP
ncbi:alpha/beta hydrolase family protein [Undibacterium sp. SXout7W]|uniref:alpha/beta hydrolase family protein n=1 Tax=Undibacterium sp. SXout7W TaxID=3413049 RepID=UPI003BF08541